MRERKSIESKREWIFDGRVIKPRVRQSVRRVDELGLLPQRCGK
ncbi:MAG: hypothetical protein RMI79_06030 [Nitrososphaerota archaeon]|nr:hypothetical protein [Nitrososphaerota archaeon]